MSININDNKKFAIVGYQKLINKMCPQCGYLASHKEHTTCPKHNIPLSTPFRIVDGKKEFYAFTEIGIYIGNQDAQAEYAERRSRRKGAIMTHSFRLYCYLDKQTNQLVQDKRVPYLYPKRPILISYHKEPTARVYLTKEGKSAVDLRIDFDKEDKHAITFLPDGKKSVMAPETHKVATTNSNSGMSKEVIAKSLGMDTATMENMMAMFQMFSKSITTPATIPTKAPVGVIAEGGFSADEINSMMDESAGFGEMIEECGFEEAAYEQYNEDDYNDCSDSSIPTVF